MPAIRFLPAVPRGLGALLAALTGLYLLAGVAAMLWLSPKVPYADPWRFLAALSTLPFPNNVLHADNGHREVLPNLLRLAELHWLGANQWLQIATGAALALATFLVLAFTLRERDHEHDGEPIRRCALLCCVALMLFWLGNQRTLAHGNESVHAYLITLCLALGLHLLRRNDAVAALGAAVLGLVATFSFGTGIACFAAFALCLWLQRARWPLWLILLAGGALSAALYLAGNADAGRLQWAPLTQMPLLLRWLATPFLYLLWPATDAAVAAQVPTALGPAVAVPVARQWQALFGAGPTATWPWLGIGVVGALWFATLVLAVRRQRERASAAIVGLGVAAFALAVGGVIVAARVDYFGRLHPDQLMATRYAVWSSLFWGGLLLASVALARPRARLAVLAVAAVAVLALPSQLWMGQLAWRMRGAAEYGAAGAAVGVLDASPAVGETVPSELASALPSLRHRQASIFGWPETPLLGRIIAGGHTAPVVAEVWEVQAIDNRLGAPGMRVSFRASAAAERLLIVDGDQRAIGLAVPDRRRNRGYWNGWIRGQDAAGSLRAVQLMAQ